MSLWLIRYHWLRNGGVAVNLQRPDFVKGYDIDKASKLVEYKFYRLLLLSFGYFRQSLKEYVSRFKYNI